MNSVLRCSSSLDEYIKNVKVIKLSRAPKKKKKVQKTSWQNVQQAHVARQQTQVQPVNNSSGKNCSATAKFPGRINWIAVV